MRFLRIGKRCRSRGLSARSSINKPVKGHKPRIIGISRDFIERLNLLPRKSERIFPGSRYTLYRNFYDQRKRFAREFNNPRLLKITFTTYRHWKATMEYHETKDILWVMKLLGHNSLTTTLIYIDLEKATFMKSNDEFTVKVPETLDEACKLLEVGYEYVTDMNNAKLFRNESSRILQFAKKILQFGGTRDLWRHLPQTLFFFSDNRRLKECAGLMITSKGLIKTQIVNYWVISK